MHQGCGARHALANTFSNEELETVYDMFQESAPHRTPSTGVLFPEGVKLFQSV